MSRSSYNLRLQKRIYSSIEENGSIYPVRKSKELVRYERDYYREFLTNITPSSKSSLTATILKSDIVYCGDFHSFRQSQKTLIRLLRGTLLKVEDRKVCIGLECISSSYQNELDAFLQGDFNLDQLRSKVAFDSNWIFPWENYAVIFEYARENGLELLALNEDIHAEKLKLFERDLYSGRIIANHKLNHPKDLLFVLYGDLHLARKHLPKATSEILRSNNKRVKSTIIFQNEPSIYWKLAEMQLSHTTEVVKLKSNTWCVINATPWVRLQAHFDWIETGSSSSQGLDFPDETYDEDDDDDFALHTSLPSKINLIANHVLHAMQVSGPTEFAINIVPFEAVSNLVEHTKNPSTPMLEARTIRSSIFLAHPIYIPEEDAAYIPAYSLSAISEIAAQLIRRHFCPEETWYLNPQMEFCRLSLQIARNFFVSKLLNPKRRCEEIPDIKLFLAETHNRKLRRGKRFKRKCLGSVIRCIDWLDGNRRSLSLPLAKDSRYAIGYEAARYVGSIVGERLYHAWESQKFDLPSAQNFLIGAVESEQAAKRLLLELSKHWKASGYKPKPKKEHL